MTDTTWVPGDPLMPDHGLNGGISSVTLSPTERADIRDEGGPTPPWYRPEPEGPNLSSTRACKPCGVRWRGPDPCWSCGQEPDA